MHLFQVDDNMVNQRVATSMLKRYGAIVSSVNTGTAAVAAVTNQKEDAKLDLVLMDIQMPEVYFTTLLKSYSFLSFQEHPNLQQCCVNHCLLI